VERLELGDEFGDDHEPELVGLGGEGEGHGHSSTPLNTAHTTVTTPSSELLREARMLSRAHQGSPAATPLGEQVCSDNITDIVHVINIIQNNGHLSVHFYDIPRESHMLSPRHQCSPVAAVLGEHSQVSILLLIVSLFECIEKNIYLCV
jgi:hypothetical protein